MAKHEGPHTLRIPIGQLWWDETGPRAIGHCGALELKAK